jgi:beta-phosphoglucomutase-like phosphatase (HAD superfamily)
MSSQCREGKPSPQIFLLAAKKLNVPPGDCVVMEDAIAGVAGARRAGTKCVGVTNSHTREDLKDADLIVDSLEKIGVGDLERLFQNS